MKHDDILGEAVPEEEAVVARQAVMTMVQKATPWTHTCTYYHISIVSKQSIPRSSRCCSRGA